MTGRPSRRTVLIGGAAGLVCLAAAAVGGVEAGLLPGRPGLDHALGLDDVDGDRPSTEPGPVDYHSFDSTARGRRVSWGLFRPDDRPAKGLPVVLSLHGRGGDARSTHDVLLADAYLADHVRRGGAPLVIVSVDGADTYWHPRRDGDDPLAMILDELLPRVGDLGARVDRVGVVGYSMGGYAGLMLARESEADRLGGLRVAAAAASSPALFASAAASSPGAFDGPADWHRWGDLAAHPQVARTPLHVDCGTSDPFAEQTRRYRRNCARTPAGGFSKGGHHPDYWRSVLPDQLTFLSQQLSGG
ncbi:alpha/beta hydrolase-fold protein [Angustibacter sp. McL0619]|uniref:alpha/beta hydrolase-fold protein n=1 Tax=Angustibacter sp. McL0619 TaxID=3415676 RepID=UPI003CFA9758